MMPPLATEFSDRAQSRRCRLDFSCSGCWQSPIPHLHATEQLRQPKLLAHILKQNVGAYLAFLPQSLKLNVTKGVRRKLLGMFLVVPFLIFIDLGAVDVLVLGIATLANALPGEGTDFCLLKWLVTS